MPPVRSFPTPRTTPRTWCAAALVATALILTVGCGGDDAPVSAAYEAAEPSSGAAERERAPADRSEARAALAAAREAVARQSSAVDSATGEVDTLRAELEAAESRLQLARGGLDAEQRRLARAEEQMRRFAVPDSVLFRNVQRELLDAGALRDVAIAAEVKKGVVTLRGRVPDERAHQAALEIAGDVDGVISVDDLIEVAESD